MHEPDCEEHQGLRLLSLDGGGVRGLSALLILREIMWRIQSEDNLKKQPLPCDYFDLIGGTSTGGLTALMLGRLGMSVVQAIEGYGALVEKVFSDVKQTRRGGKFKASNLEEVIKKIVKYQTGHSDARMMDIRSTSQSCKTFVCAMGALNMSAGIPRLFRTYTAPKNQTFNCKIWEAARATCAAPTFFKRIVIGEVGSSEPYIDGGMSCNNPISQLLQEAELIFPGRHVACIVSIGTGKAQTISIPKPSMFHNMLPLDVVGAMSCIATDCERSAQEIARRFQRTPNFYFRLNVEQGLQEVGLAQWERLNEVNSHTEQYIRMAEVDQTLGAVVMALRGRKNIIDTAYIGGTVQPSALPQPSLKCCPPPTSVFTGRNDILVQMQDFFSCDVGTRHVFVLHGLGGAGKSQIAFKFVERCQFGPEPTRFSNVYFIDASTEETISADLKNIACAKGIGSAAQDTLGWLARQREQWLLLLDNADDTTFNLRKYFPLCSHGNILITSRNRDTLRHASSRRSHCQVPRMNDRDARDLLLETAGVGEEHTQETEALATTIVKELGHLALAVVQAGAYISSTECGLRCYLEMYRERCGGLLEEYRDNVQKIDDYKWTVYTTWRMSFRQLKVQAATFLQLCAFMHHDGLSEAIFEKAAASIFSQVPVAVQTLEALSKAKDFLGAFWTSESTWDHQMFLRMISEIRSYSLIDFDRVNQTYSIHPLVHAWTRTTISNCDVICNVVQCILGTSVHWEYTSEDYVFRRAILPHVETALQCDVAIGPDICARFALIYSESGRWKKAEELCVQVMEARTSVLGPEHLDTLTSMASLSETFRSQGKWKEAEQLQVQVKEARMSVLGIEHPVTLTSMGNLALTYQRQGRWKEAAELEVRVMEARTRVLGEEHPHTLTSMANLAATYQRHGRWKEAEQLEVRVKEARTRVLGAEHPETLTSMGNLALTYQRQGKWNEATELEVQVTEARTRVLGVEHPETLTSMVNLASMFWEQGQWNEAEELEVRVLEARTRLLGVDHPDTLRIMANLAATFWNQGRLEETEELEVQVMKARVGVIGENHPDTLTSMGNLAATYQSQGRSTEAEELRVHVMKASTRVLGAEHPDTLTSIVNLAGTFRSQGRQAEAEHLLVQAKDASIRVLGAGHPATLTSMEGLALTFQSQGRLNEAEELLVQVKEARTKALGADHPYTLETIDSLAQLVLE